MKNRETLEVWLVRACAAFGHTPQSARQLWIAVRSGDANAKVELNRIQREFPDFHEIWEQFAKETKQRRRDAGKPTPKSFGRPEAAPKVAWTSLQDNRVKGVSTVHQGGLPSLGKRAR